MPFPYTIHIGGQPILLHGIFEFFGIFAAFRYYLVLKKKQGDTIEPLSRLFVVTAATLGAVLGSRLIGSLENIPQWRAAPSAWKYFYGNKTLVGGLLGGLVCVELVKKITGERRNTGDLFTFPLLMGMIIGRIGCFSAGVSEETYGIPSDLPWAMNLGDGILRHPVVLYEIFFLSALWLFLIVVKRNYSLQEGALFKMFLMLYLAFRFLLDFIKPGWHYFVGLGTIQLSCLAGLVYYARYIISPGLLISKNVYAS
jgi:phosphatidylglycerol---prolipoprotein diacylglyceryl transferase